MLSKVPSRSDIYLLSSSVFVLVPGLWRGGDRCQNSEALRVDNLSQDCRGPEAKCARPCINIKDNGLNVAKLEFFRYGKRTNQGPLFVLHATSYSLTVVTCWRLSEEYLYGHHPVLMAFTWLQPAAFCSLAVTIINLNFYPTDKQQW